MINILVVDDEPAMREGLSDNLLFEGYEVTTAKDGPAALIALHQTVFDLVILDVMMPKMSGFDVCKRLREKDNQVPIILLTAKGEEIDRVLGLEFGADDYIAKPFSLRELLARIKAILRRSRLYHNPTAGNQTQQIGRLKVDFEKYEAWMGEAKVKLSVREFEVLHFLWMNRQHVVSRNDLLEKVWQYDEFPTTRTVDNFILRIRQKVEINPNRPKKIVTIHGIGYKML